MNTSHQIYLNKNKTIDVHIVSAGNSHHVSFYNDLTDKSIAYTCDSKELKDLADFLYKTINHEPK